MEKTIRQIVLPPREVFQYPKPETDIGGDPVAYLDGKRKQMGGFEAQNWIETVCPPEGGIYSYHEGDPYPRKGHTYLEAVESNNTVKRITLTMVLPLASKEMALPALGFMLTPYKWKIRLLEKFLVHYRRLAELHMGQHFLKPEYYNICSKELWNFVYRFLKELGIDPELSHALGRIVATMFEYDDAYRYRLEDVLTETDKVKLKKPRQEILRLLKIYQSRELYKGENAVGGRMEKMAKGLSFLMLYPPVKRAFKKALAESDLSNLQLDEIDRYFCLNRPDYQFFGQPLANRMFFYGAMRTAHKLKTEQPAPA